MYSVLGLTLLSCVVGGMSAGVASLTTTVSNDHPAIHYHGRWDKSPGTWWTGSGFKLHAKNLRNLTLNLGDHTTSPYAAVGVSIDYQDFVTVNASVGTTVIPLDGISTAKNAESVVRINVEGWQNNRINLESLTLNSDAELLTYTPSKLAFQFIGDSLSAGQYLTQGVDQAWPFLTGEYFKAEHNINAQPGAALTDIVSYGNEHGISYQYFKTEDTGYYYTTDHNYTTPWDFARDQTPTHIVIHVGANDASQGVTDATFTEVYTLFLARLRILYPHQPIFIFTPWGWPSADGPNSYYYAGVYQTIVDLRKALGDKDIFLVNTTGWVTYADVFPDNLHPTVQGHIKIAGLFETWLENWGFKGEAQWATSV